MFGFFFGTLCLVGLAKVLRGRRPGGCGGGYGYGAWQGHGWRHGHGHHHRGGYGPRQALRFAFARLGTSVAQEREILAAFSDLQATRGELRAQMERAQAELATAFRGEVLDEGTLAPVHERVDALFAEGRVAMTTALRRVHEVLDPAQRAQVAEVLGGEGGPFGGHPFRGAL